MAQQEEAKKVTVPLTEEQTPNKRNIPKVVFIENVDAWVDKYNEDVVF